MTDPLKLFVPEDSKSLEEVAEVFAARITAGQDLIVEVPLPSVGSSNSYLDLVQDFCDASLVCERLGACAGERAMRWSKSGYMNVIHLELRGYLPEVMALELARMAIFLDFPEREVESLRGEYEDAREAAFDHEDSIPHAHLLFPEIADHYLGNLVIGAYYEWQDAEALRAALQMHPERRYGFFVMRSVSPGHLPVLSSDSQLIVPSGVPLEEVLQAVGYGGEQLLPATMLMTEQEVSFVASHAVVGVKAGDLTNAIACGDDFARRIQDEPDSHDLLTFQGQIAGTAGHPAAKVGELSGCATLNCGGFTILFLDTQLLSEWELEGRAERLRALEVCLHDGGSPSKVLDLAWESLDDELFEQLCYDYLYALPFFDRYRLEKIGKSRSRDGGRDIVAWTNPAPSLFRPPAKYIFQCKHIGANASLSPKHFQSVADIIEQYGAGGYGVMCSGYIDATLHDRLDAIAERRGIGVRKVDRLQFERFLSRRPHLIERYFRRC